MKGKYFIIVLALGVFLVSGCADKTNNNPTRPNTPPQGYVFKQNFHSYSIFFSTSNDRPGGEHGDKPYNAYTPPGYLNSTDGRFPVLYLLPPFRSDELYYFEHGLAQVADRLIAEGKIIPMIIVTVDGRSLLGGSFYVDSPRQGRFATALTEYASYTVPRYTSMGQLVDVTYGAPSLISRIDDNFRTVAESRFRAIGGIGMGGYGAARLALTTDKFNSVSAINAPLDFDGAGADGFRSLINQVYPAGSPWSSVDTSLHNPAMSLLVSAAAAFSPQHQAFRVDSIYRLVNVDVISYTITDSLTTDKRSYLPRHHAHMPFDSTGVINDDIWQVWMHNNIDYLYQQADGNNQNRFRLMRKLMVTTGYDEYFFNEQMNAFAAFLRASNMTFDEKTLPGTTMLTAGADRYLYDLLEDVLIFHSEAFKAAGW